MNPLKKFSQNFCVDDNVLNRIIAACDLNNDDNVLEIGPGLGALTQKILPFVKKLTAVEADARLASDLRLQIPDKKLLLHHADILGFDFLLGTQKKPIKVIGNLPYNISTPIIEKLLTERAKICTAFITVQQEFGARLTANPGTKDYSSLTCLTNFFAVPKILFRISNRSFRPIPKVESCFMRIDFRQHALVELKDEDLFIKIVRTAFCQRRKTILNALAPLVGKPKLQLALAHCGINEKFRPEDVSPKDYATLSNVL